MGTTGMYGLTVSLKMRLIYNGPWGKPRYLEQNHVLFQLIFE